MNRKGLFFSVLIIMVVTVISVSISACENEKNDGGGNSGVAYMDFIEGTWTGGEEKVNYTFGFNKDGTGTYVCNSQSSGNQTYTGTFTYFMTGNNSGFMVVKYRADFFGPGEYGREMYYFVIENNKMYLLEGDDGLILSNDNALSIADKTIEGTLTGGEEKVTYTFGFSKDGTGTYVCNSQSSGNQTYTGTLTYSMTTNNSGFMIVKYRADFFDPGEYGREMYYFVIENNKMYLLEGDDGLILSNDNALSIADKTIEGTLTGGEEKVTYTFGFSKDGTGTYVCNSQSSGNQTYTGTLTYSMTTNNSGFMIVKYRADFFDPGEYGREMYLFVVENNKMYLLEGDEGLVLSMQ